MIIMKTDATPEQITHVVKEIKRYGLAAVTPQIAKRIGIVNPAAT